MRTNPVTLKLGSRGSRLAMWQAHHVKALLEKENPGLTVKIVEVKTRGDRVRRTDLTATGGIGFFTKEIEQALLDRRVDVAVHSLKDLPTELVAGLALAAVPKREDTRDALIGRAGRVYGLGDLRPGVTVGTGSPRRKGQLLASFPGLDVQPIRGNVPRRIARTEEEGGPDAVILAMAGLIRLELTDRVSEVIPLDRMLPAPGQGALGIEVRDDDDFAREMVAPLNDPACRVEVRAERAFLRRLEGGCTVPAGALGTLETDGRLRLRGVVADPEGRAIFREMRDGSPSDPEILGAVLADKLLSQGADKLLAGLRTGK